MTTTELLVNARSEMRFSIDAFKAVKECLAENKYAADLCDLRIRRLREAEESITAQLMKEGAEDAQ